MSSVTTAGPSDTRVITSLFKKYDADGSGALDLKEIRDMVYDLGYCMSTEEVEATQMQLDRNGNGTIELSEFIEWWGLGDNRFKTLDNAQLARMSAAIQMFRQYDKNMDGSISIDEFKELCVALGQTYTPEQVQKAFAAVDTDNSQRIVFSEFMQWLKWF